MTLAHKYITGLPHVSTYCRPIQQSEQIHLGVVQVCRKHD